jgi:hypothetical protein
MFTVLLPCVPTFSPVSIFSTRTFRTSSSPLALEQLADMIHEHDCARFKARFDVDCQKSSHREEVKRLRHEINFNCEMVDDATLSKSSEMSGLLQRYDRQISELEDSL